MKHQDFSLISSFLNAQRKNADIKEMHNDSYYKGQDLEAVQIRSNAYNNYLQEYVSSFSKKSKTLKLMKWLFFIVIILILITVLIATYVSLIEISKKPTLRLQT